MNYIIHSGVKGQKWGVRRYQNEDGSYTKEGYYHRYGKYPNEYGGKDSGRIWPNENLKTGSGDDYIIKKGTKFERVTTDPDEKFNARTYVSMGASVYLNALYNPNGHMYIDQLETERDTIIAGRNTIKDILENMDSADSKKILRSINDPYWYMDKPSTKIKKKTDTQFSILKTMLGIKEKPEEVMKKGIDKLDDPGDFMKNPNLKVTKDFINELKNRGYDGIPDPSDSNLGIGYEPTATIYVRDILKKKGQEVY